MPFTLSHPAAVIPLARRPLLVSALVAGSVAPDVPYFVPLAGDSADSLRGRLDINLTLTHDPASAWWIDTVLAVLLLVAFHVLLKRPLAALLPVAAAGRVRSAAAGFRWGGRNLVWIPVSVLLGVATHLVWDSFTHGDGFFVEHVPLMRTPLAGSLDVARALQHLSTLGGAAVLAGWLARWWRRTRPEPVEPGTVLAPRPRYAVLTLMTLAGATGAVVNAVRGAGDGATLESLAVAAAVGAVAGLGLSLALYAVGWQLHRPFARRRAAAPAPAGVASP
ncbi:DUF4184 family protein [Dactylosporangium sp. CA-139114]|uniref:DUF4184 family protein n=1 Tax=Dactylosporangium sp. CA-139114 TaxID=3239931 RepID=UPI003D99152D